MISAKPETAINSGTGTGETFNNLIACISGKKHCPSIKLSLVSIYKHFKDIKGTIVTNKAMTKLKNTNVTQERKLRTPEE